MSVIDPLDSTPAPAPARGPKRRRQKPLADREPIALSDVARAAGVSTASASRALTRPALVSDALRERVRYAASTLGYVANTAARSLSMRRSGLVGAVVGDLVDPAVAEVLQAAQWRLSRYGTDLLISVAGNESPVETCARALAARGVDGMLFIAVGGVPDDAYWAGGRTVPSVSVGQLSRGGPNRMADERLWGRGLELIRRYLHEMGHRRIGVITQGPGPDQAAPEAARRDEAVILWHAVAQLQDLDAVRAAARLLLSREATALVAVGDLAAAATLRECAFLNLSVPQQVSIVGWGDTALARCLSPSLTSLRLPGRESGEAAAEALQAAIAHGEYRRPELSVKLVIRESTGPAPS